MSRTLLRRDEDTGDVVVQTTLPGHLWCELVASVAKGGLTADVRAQIETLHFDEPDEAAKVRSLAPGDYIALKRVLEGAKALLQPRPSGVADYAYGVILCERLDELRRIVDAVNEHALP